jgi:hypothetical protein
LYVAPAVVVIALIVFLIGFAQPSRATLAWSPTADTSPLAPSAELKTICTEGMPITAQQLDLLTDESLDLVDTRGNASLAVWSTPTLRLHCMLLSDDSGALVRGPAMLSEPVAQNGTQLNIEFMAGTEWMNEMVMVLSGHAPEGTADVAVVGQESEDFSASVNSAGQFAVRRGTNSPPCNLLITTLTPERDRQRRPLMAQVTEQIQIQHQRCLAGACWILSARCHLLGVETEPLSQRRLRTSECQLKCERAHRW